MKHNYFKHTSAFIDKGAKIGNDTKIWHNAHVTDTAEIGNNCIISQNCYIAGKMGNGCKLQNNVSIYQGVEMKDWVFCGPSMTFTNDINPRAKYPKNGKFIKTFVDEGASIGAHVTVVCGVNIGKWAFIGAGSIVTKDIPAYAIAYGSPANIKGWICECGEKLPEEFDKTKCKNCNRLYVKHDFIVKEIK